MYNRNILIEQTDPELFAAIQAENARQEHHIELIASENYASPAVMAAQGSQLTNKYAEGYPGKRYYGGCEHVDVAEQLAIDRIKQLYGAEFANVQPHSGSQANEAVFLAFLKPGDTIMGMSLAEGGHLTHGMPLNMSGKWFNVVSYGLDKNEAIDYDAMEAKAREHKPKLIAAGVYPNPVPFADVVTSTTHKSLRGPRGGIILMKAEHEKAINSAIFPGLQGGPLMHVIAAKEAEAVLGSAHMTINKNAIPNDPEKPMVTSGVRIGTPAMTTRGFKDEEARITANLIADVLDNPRDEANIAAVREKVNALTRRFPVYG